MRVPSLYFTCHSRVCVRACVFDPNNGNYIYITYDTCRIGTIKKIGKKTKKKKWRERFDEVKKCFDNAMILRRFFHGRNGEGSPRGNRILSSPFSSSFILFILFIRPNQSYWIYLARTFPLPFPKHVDAFMEKLFRTNNVFSNSLLGGKWLPTFELSRAAVLLTY